MFKLVEARFSEGYAWYDITVAVDRALPTHHGTNLGAWPYARVVASGQYFVWEEMLGLFTFGLYVAEDPLHGNQPYVWSSRASVLGHYIGEHMVDVCVRGKDGYVVAGYAMRPCHLEPLLPPGCTVVPFERDIELGAAVRSVGV